jgi:DNA-binding NtrC family response regulator
MWRLNGQKLLLPPLRSRLEDIESLCLYFLENERPRRNKRFEPDAITALQEQPWPGNVRELKRACEQLCLHSPLPFVRKTDVQTILPVARLSRPASSFNGPSQTIDLSRGLNDLLAGFEAEIIRAVLTKNPDVDQAALLLKISRSSLYKKMKDYNIEARS